MFDVLSKIAPSVGIVALIALWVFLMLVAASYFHRYVPEVSGPAQWNPGLVRVGMVLLMAIIGALVAERQALPRGHHTWVGLAGGLLGLLIEWLWRVVDRRLPPPGTPSER